MLFYFNLGARWGWVVNATPLLLYPRERPGTHCIAGAVGPRAGLDGCGKFRLPTGTRSSDLPARSESPYRLSYPGPNIYDGLLGCGILYCCRYISTFWRKLLPPFSEILISYDLSCGLRQQVRGGKKTRYLFLN